MKKHIWTALFWVWVGFVGVSTRYCCQVPDRWSNKGAIAHVKP